MYMTKPTENFIVSTDSLSSPGNSFFLMRPMVAHDQSEIEVAQLMACMSTPALVEAPNVEHVNRDHMNNNNNNNNNQGGGGCLGGVLGGGGMGGIGGIGGPSCIPPHPSNLRFYPPTGSRNFVYHPLASMSFEMGDTQATTRGRRTSPKKLILSPSRSPCPNCGVESSTLWRNCDLQTGSHYLCNACGLRYKKGKYCPLCYQVYYDADTNLLYWAQCQSCSNWTHKSCLLAISALLPSPYVCCRCAPHSNANATVSTSPGTGGLC